MVEEYFKLKEEVLALLPERSERKLGLREKWNDTLTITTNHPHQLKEARDDLYKAMMYARVPNLDARENITNATSALAEVYMRFFTDGPKATAQLIEEDKAIISRALDARLGERHGLAK